MAVPVQTLITHVLVNGLAVYAPGEPIKPADAITVLDGINSVLDDWAAETQASYAETFTVAVSTGANPEVIGPGGSGAWLMAARPVSIDGLAYDLGTGIYRDIYVTMDPNWWANQTVIAPGIPYGAYYEPSEPNGKLYFNSTATTGTNLRLMMRTTLGPVAQTDSMTLPQGYQSALELTAAERVARSFHAVVDADMKADAGKARARIWANNLRIPTLSTVGQGLPGQRGGWFDFLTRTWRA